MICELSGIPLLFVTYIHGPSRSVESTALRRVGADRTATTQTGGVFPFDDHTREYLLRARAAGDLELMEPITLASQGSFLAGGRIITGPDGDTAHVDHAYVQYQIPIAPRKYPLVMWHGGGQSAKTWESTPDGRDGFQNIFLRRRFSTYIFDQPWRGRGGRGADIVTLPAVKPIDALVFTIFRLGVWSPPEPARFFDNVQFPRDAHSLDQYYRQQLPNIGPENRDAVTRDVMSHACGALFNKIGAAILLTHSNSGQYGWVTAIKNAKVKAIVAYEPGSFVFPAGEVPAPVETGDPLAAALAEPIVIPPEDFDKLTNIPIQLVYGDNIEFVHPTSITGVELWRVNARRAVQFRDALNQRGGNVELLHLPQAGLRGNTHFPFSDLNNLSIADQLSTFLARHGLAGD